MKTVTDQPAMPENQSQPGRRILVVEDHEDTVLYVSQYLESGGHSVLAARNMNEARESVLRWKPDLLLCDINLPDGDGWNLLDGLGADRPPLCIAMSGRAMNADLRRSKSVGFDHHLVKPFLPDELEALLRQI